MAIMHYWCQAICGIFASRACFQITISRNVSRLSGIFLFKYVLKNRNCTVFQFNFSNSIPARISLRISAGGVPFKILIIKAKTIAHALRQ